MAQSNGKSKYVRVDFIIAGGVKDPERRSVIHREEGGVAACGWTMPDSGAIVSTISVLPTLEVRYCERTGCKGHLQQMTEVVPTSLACECGADNAAGAIICSKCGRPLAAGD